MRFVSFDNHLHLFYRYEKNLIIISVLPNKGSGGICHTVFLSLHLLQFLLLNYQHSGTIYKKKDFKLQFNFNSRIQLTIVMIVVGTLLLIGAATVTYIVDNYEQATEQPHP
jgi:hypothetical protein